MSTNPLIENLIKNKNLSGAIPSAPHGIKDLTEKIQGLNFAVGSPGISNLMNGGNMMQGLNLLAQLLGGLSALGGNANKVVAQASKQVGVPVSNTNAQAIGQVIDPAKVEAALDPAQALIASLVGFNG